MPEGITDRSIELFSGARYTPNGAVDLSIEDIAHSLGNQCRYTGHCRHFYSVAEHSVLCSMLAEELGLCDPFEALMHDAHEAVISDVAAPWKQYLPDLQKAEKVAELDLRSRHNLPLETTEGCKDIDYIALYIEAYYLMKSKGEDFIDPRNLRVDALRLIKRNGWKVAGLEPALAKTAFILRYRDLCPEGRQEQEWEHQDKAGAIQ